MRSSSTAGTGGTACCFRTATNPFYARRSRILLALVRYIHLNPLRAGAVQDIDALRGYLRSGHSALVGKVSRKWQDTDHVLRLFSGRLRQARKAYEAFVAEGVGQGRRPDLVGGGLVRSAGGWSAVKSLRYSGMRIMGDERILGSGDFVQIRARSGTGAI
ncbi:MAG: hypothetical protein MZV70_51745 [Desulfobacterales bacterium]|nr:hypothetical protein [Desulfobacterales bacterium]